MKKEKLEMGNRETMSSLISEQPKAKKRKRSKPINKVKTKIVKL